jgi:citrate lyase beta subunit/acyl dehydratase
MSAGSRVPQGPSPHAWRTLLFLPQFAFPQAARLGSDAFIVDFQDSVPLGAKALVREGLRGALEAGMFGGRPVVVRLNEAAWADELRRDLDAVVGREGVAALMPTMLERPEELEALDAELLARERALGLAGGATKLLPLIETPAAVLRCDAIARAGRGRLVGLMLGHGDLFRLTGAQPESRTTLDLPRNAVVLAARAAGVAAFDTPYTRASDALGLERDARDAKRHGFDGKACIHRDQLEAVARWMRPGAEELAWARRIEQARTAGALSTLVRKLEASAGESAARDTDGMALVDGQLVGPPHIKASQRILQREAAEAPAAGRVGRVVAHRFAAGLSAGAALDNPYECTITDGMRDLWAQCFYTHDAAGTSRPFAAALGRCDGGAMPAPFLMALYLAVSMSDTHGAIYHLGFRAGRQLGPLQVGDTVRQRIRVSAVRNTRDGKRAVVSTVRELVRDDDAVLFRVEKLELHAAEPADVGEAPPPLDARAVLPGGDALLEAAKRAVPGLLAAREAWPAVGRPREAFEAGEVLLHAFARPLGTTANLGLSTQFLVTHPIHLDHHRFDQGDGTGVVVSGGLVIALVCSAAARDLSHVVWEELLVANNVRPVSPGETVGALSVIVDRGDVPLAPELEVLVVKTIGVKGLNPAAELRETALPEALLAPVVGGGGRHDELCRAHGLRALEGKVVAEVLRRIVRIRPGR